MIRRFFLILGLLFVTACDPATPWYGAQVLAHQIIEPAVSFGEFNPIGAEIIVPEDAPEIYKKAVEQGYKSGLAAYGNSIYKSKYKYAIDPDLIDDPVYYRGWVDSFNYGRAYANRYLNSGFFEGIGFIGKSNGEPFSDKDLRGNKTIEVGYNVWPDSFHGVDLPGWNESPGGGVFGSIMGNGDLGKVFFGDSNGTYNLQQTGNIGDFLVPQGL